MGDLNDQHKLDTTIHVNSDLSEWRVTIHAFDSVRNKVGLVFVFVCLEAVRPS